ncbi:MAG TPA: hypothetical protein VG651_15910 [Stellaceae bacterium]|nr:hypothetical protein [Stellaceae bacterium]
MSQAERGARHVRRAAEHEHKGKRGESDAESAAAHVDVTEAKQGRPPLNRDWRDKPVDQERDKDIKQGGIEGAERGRRGRR